VCPYKYYGKQECIGVHADNVTCSTLSSQTSVKKRTENNENNLGVRSGAVVLSTSRRRGHCLSAPGGLRMTTVEVYTEPDLDTWVLCSRSRI
jgi:hypothetical protein